MQNNKKRALKSSQGNYDSPCVLSTKSLEDLNCWANTLWNISNDINRTLPELAMGLDASNIGWGVACKNKQTGGIGQCMNPNNILIC